MFKDKMEEIIDKLNKQDKKLSNIEIKLNLETPGVNVVDDGPRKPSLPIPSLTIKPSVTMRMREALNKKEVVRHELINPYWIEQDNHIRNGPQRFLKASEVTFWNKVIDKYLKPLDKDKEKEKKDLQGLIELRNTWVFSFLLANALWIAAFVVVNLNKDSIYIS